MRDRCPADAELFAFASGDVSPGDAASLERHLEGCLQCRTLVRAWDTSSDASRETRAGQAAPTWRGFSGAVRAQNDAWLRRRRFALPRPTRSVAAALVAALVVVTLWYRQTEVLSADTVLDRAIWQEQAAAGTGAIPTFVSIQPVASTDDRGRFDRDAVAEELTRRLEMFGYSATHPLSARHFQKWRLGARSRQDRVVVKGALVSVVTTAAGDVREAEITVRGDTHEPVSQRWLFADALEVELTRVPEPPPTVAAPAPRIASEARPAAPPAGRDRDLMELRLRLTLYRMGAFVDGKVLSVEQTAAEVRVHGHVATSQIAEQVTLFAQQSDGIASDVEVAAPGATPAVSRPEGWLERGLPEERRDAFVPRARELMEDLKTRADALVELGQRYPAEQAAQLKTESKNRLGLLHDLQYSGVVTALVAAEEHLSVIADVRREPELPSHAPDNWRRVAPSLQAAVARLSADVAGLSAIVSVSDPRTAADLQTTTRRNLRLSLQTLRLRLSGDLSSNDPAEF